MAKKVTRVVKLAIPAGSVNGSQVGTKLGPLGINLQEFCNRYNEATRDKMGDIVPVEVSVYDDRSFDLVYKTSPASFLIKKAAKLKSGSAKGSKEVVATITKEQLKEIATTKMPDLNANTVEDAMNIIAGTAKNMGVNVE